MHSVLTVAGWIVWLIGLLACLVFFRIPHPDGGVVMLSRRYAMLLSVGLIVTLFPGVSKLHLLWWALVAFPLNLLLFAGMFSLKMRGFAKNLATQTQSDCTVQADPQVAQFQAEADRLRRDLDLIKDPETICTFGQMKFDGDGVQQDYVGAAAYFLIAAEQGHARSQHNLALMYENGQGIPRDLVLAARWYRMAAEQGHAGSLNNLGALYETGEGVAQDIAIALGFYRDAVAGGDTNAVSNVQRLEALLHAKGL